MFRYIFSVYMRQRHSQYPDWFYALGIYTYWCIGIGCMRFKLIALTKTRNMAFSQTNDGVIKSYVLRFLWMWLLLNDDIETHSIKCARFIDSVLWTHSLCHTANTHTQMEEKWKKKRNQQENNDGEKTTAKKKKKQNQPKQKLYMIHTSTPILTLTRPHIV